MIVTGRNCSPIGVPPGPVAVPLAVSVDVPGAIASNSIAASRPVPDAPVASAPREIVMSTRPLFDLLRERDVRAARSHEAALLHGSHAQDRADRTSASA